jgi:hypothetical protein
MPKGDIGRHVVPTRLRSLPTSRLHLLQMLALTSSTGIVVDAVGYLGLDQVFTGNMTGNVVVPGWRRPAVTTCRSRARRSRWPAS